MNTTTTMEQLETLVGTSLPEEYRRVMQRFPSSLLLAKRAIDNSDAEGVVADVEFQSDIDAVLELNVEARADTVPDPSGIEFQWPDHFLIIGETEGGDYYCIDVTGANQGVIQFDHQAVDFELIAESLEEFIEILEDTFCSADANTGK